MPNLDEASAAIAAVYQSLLPVLPLLGVLIGALSTFWIQRHFAARSHRRELVLSTLEAVTTARSLATQTLTTWDGSRMPLEAAEEATAIWVRMEMLAGLERKEEDQRALSANGFNAHEHLMAGAVSDKDLDKLRGELSRLSTLLIAYERRRAKGRDFRLGVATVFWKFGPGFTDADLPAQD